MTPPDEIAENLAGPLLKWHRDSIEGSREDFQKAIEIYDCNVLDVFNMAEAALRIACAADELRNRLMIVAMTMTPTEGSA